MSSDLTVGYAAMLEQFHPTEAVELSAYAEEHGFSGQGAGQAQPIKKLEHARLQHQPRTEGFDA